MKRLPDILKPKGTGIPGLVAKLIIRDGEICLYERSDGCFEVFKVQVSPAVDAFGRSYPEREVYPGNEDFGKTAWCISHLENAIKKYNALVQNQNDQ